MVVVAVSIDKTLAEEKAEVAVVETTETTVAAAETIEILRKDTKPNESLKPSTLVLLLHQGFFLGLYNITIP